MKSKIHEHQKNNFTEVSKNYVIKTHKKDTHYAKPHIFILNKGLNSGKPSKEQFTNSYVFIFENEEDCENIYWITYSLWLSKFWHRNLVGSVIPFLRKSDFMKEFSAKADEMLYDFEQHKKDLQALRLLELQEKQFHQNINLINDLRRVILHRYCK
ncbi:DUF6943 family protein [Flavobacterium terrisoli]|uniref:DUF6943 family protein n=1 Tax=Flavobacterium terrisoli TaxID=3242195 RepID=UPI0025439C6E|nr:hypothetical protein [Flavobacterium buctense]